MLKLALRSITQHKTRLTMTVISIALGVAFVTGTFVFTDSIESRFDTLFTDVYAGVDATVRPEPTEFGTTTATLDPVLAEAIGAIDGVQTAAGGVGGFAQPIDPDGTPIGGQGPPNLGMSWSVEPALNALTIADGMGRPPRAAGEVVIDAATAKANDFSVGNKIDIAFVNGIERFEVVGIAGFGTEDNLAGATLAAFELNEAQRIFELDGFTQIDILGDGSVDNETLLAQIAPVLPGGVEVVSGDQQTKEQLDAVNEGLGFIQTGLLAFAAVAIFVAAFIIQNTFRITVAQRTKELALLRAIGSTARQVTRMVLVEAVAVASVASAIGVGLGIGLAELLKVILNAGGFGLPDGPLTVEPRTVIVGLAVGLFVTVISSLIPARRAARIAPVAAMRESIAASSPVSLRRRAVSGLALTVVSIAVLGIGLSEQVGNGLAWVGGGALGIFLGVSVLAPLFARPVAFVLGWPMERLFGVPGKLARDNTRRQPRRTASTASALMIGVALVAFVAVFATSTKASVETTLRGAFPADFSVRSANLNVGVGDEFIGEASGLSEFETVSALYMAEVRIADNVEQLVAVDPTTIDSVYTMGASPSTEAIGDGLFVRSDTLEEDGYQVGDVITVEFAAGEVPMEITGTFSDTSFAPFIVTIATLEKATDPGEALIVFARIADGVDREDAQAALDGAASGFATLDVQTLDEVVAQAEGQIDQLLALFQGLLGLAIVIAVLGITNTLALSVVERKREVGLLRAVGMSRRQVRRMVRWESVIIAVFGAVTGVGLGIALGWAIVTALAEDGFNVFSVPTGALAIYVVLAGVAGIVAAILPARSASRLNVLDAISYE